ncbi:MAG: phytanoyl-CoA dioxygenase family protein [Myxococcota bacterium]|nr:phytanoyl-CoA dioxygenase family protein [Myxococcota bacterium]
MLEIQWTEHERAHWSSRHFVKREHALSALAVNDLNAWVTELAEWPESPGKWMKYFEAGHAHRQLCRVENFVQYHGELSALLRGPAVIDAVGALMGRAAVLFKEKINFKLPGGAGFEAHQDAPAFGMFGHAYHVTMMVAVDDATEANGCLEFADPVAVGELLAQTDSGTIHPDVVASLDWEPCEVRAGDVVFFDSYVPHRSNRNESQSARRALYVTYNALADGDVRTAYFEQKRAAFPPECERVAGVDYAGQTSPFNLGNPIR